MPLYENHNYLNKDIEYLISKEIIEYDMKSAGFNIVKRFKLLPDKEIDYIESLDKKARQRAIGLNQKDKEFAEKLNNGFVAMRKEFFEANSLNDDEVLSIKKDAIITLRRCRNVEFDNVVFAEKNTYTSYYYLAKNEFYLGKDKLDVKGISDEKLSLHKDYMIDFLMNLFKMIEVSPHSRIMRQITDFSYYYKHKDLEIGYYRELNRESLFRLEKKFNNQMLGLAYTSDLDLVDISFNYLRYIVPIIKMII